MVSTVIRKTERSESGRPEVPSESDAVRAMENAILMLEAGVMTALDISKSRQCHASEDIYWDRLLKRIAMPVSLALTEYRGPRRMHHEYHPDTHSMGHTPLLSTSPLSLLLKVCRIALAESEEMSHVSNVAVDADKKEFEHALRDFLHAYMRLFPVPVKSSRKKKKNAEMAG